MDVEKQNAKDRKRAARLRDKQDRGVRLSERDRDWLNKFDKRDLELREGGPLNAEAMAAQARDQQIAWQKNIELAETEELKIERLRLRSCGLNLAGSVLIARKQADNLTIRRDVRAHLNIQICAMMGYAPLVYREIHAGVFHPHTMARRVCGCQVALTPRTSAFLW